MEIEGFLDTHLVPGKLLFAKVWGSRSHHTEVETSDWDFSGVYILPTKTILSIGYSPAEMETYDGKAPDYSFHEVRKFCELLIKGNPTIIEMLWTERMCTSSPTWDELKKHRRKFLTKNTVEQYVGYVESQLRRLHRHDGKAGLHTKSGAYTEKWAYHIARILGDAMRIAQGGEPEVWKEGKERDFLLHIRHNDYTWQQISSHIEEKLALIKGLSPWNLPEHADDELLNNWLLEIRSAN